MEGSNGTPAKPAAIEEEDIFDDIEGALGVMKPPAAKKRQVKTLPKEDATTADELNEPSTTPKRGRLRSTKNVQSASRSAFKSLVSSYKHEEDMETDTTDELAEAPTSSKRTKTPRSAVRKTPAARSTGRRKKETGPEDAGKSEDEEVDMMEAIAVTPS